MYYDSLRRKVRASIAAREAAGEAVAITEKIAPCYLPLHEDIAACRHETYYLPGGRGSCKSSFVSLEMIDGIMQDPTANGIVFRRVAGTMRDSVFSQVQWAIDALGAADKWRGNVSPMQYTYLPTGQQILFRGLDDPLKLKSVKPRRGAFKFIWFEEYAELPGANMVRSVLQSVARGGEGFRVFASFNPPQSLNNWANKRILEPNPRAIVFRTDYRMIPEEWLGETFLAEAARLQSINELAYRHEYLGEATGTGGEVFTALEVREIPDEEVQLTSDYVRGGIDFGFAVDPAVCIVCSYDQKHEEIKLLGEIYKRGLSNKQLAEAIKAQSFDHTGKKYRSPLTGETMGETRMFIADAAEPKSIADLRTNGLHCTACTKWPGSVLYGIKWLQQRRIIIDPKRTPNAFREFTSYEYAQTKDGEFLADVPDRDNHCIDALRYALDREISRFRNSA